MVGNTVSTYSAHRDLIRIPLKLPRAPGDPEFLITTLLLFSPACSSTEDQ